MTEAPKLPKLHVEEAKNNRTYPGLIGPLGGLGRRGGGSLVREDSVLPATSGPREGQIGTAHPPRQGGTSVEIALGLHPCMQRCSGVRCISLEPQAWVVVLMAICPVRKKW